MAEGFDYVLEPFISWAQGQYPTAQLPMALMDSKTKVVMFRNISESPVRLEAGQTLGRAIMSQAGCIKADLDMIIDWADMIRPGQAKWDISGEKALSFVCPNLDKPPMGKALDTELDALASLVVETDHSWVNKPRSISEEQITRIARGATPRVKAELFPAEFDDEEIPYPPERSSGNNLREGLVCNPELSSAMKEQLLDVLTAHERAFSINGELGKVVTTKAGIETVDGRLPPPQQLRPLGLVKRKIVEDIMKEYEAWDVIEPSTSSTCSPIVLVWQGEKWRFCVDFRKLNKVTIPDAYPMLRADYVFAALVGKQWFSIMDTLKGYHQMQLKKENWFKTAFISHKGLYQCKRLPFGLRNVPAMFQWMMDEVVGSLRWQAALVYIDNLLLYSDTWDEHLKHLACMLSAAEKAGVKFSVPKYRFGYTDVRLLGHELSRYGLHTLEEKVMAISKLQPPRTLGDLHRNCGMFGYYRSFIPKFASLIHSLNQLKKSGNEKANLTREDAKGRMVKYQARTNISDRWDDDCLRAFETLKEKLKSAPILAHPCYDRCFYLYTDASAKAFAGVLMQKWSREDYPDDEDEPEFLCIGRIKESEGASVLVDEAGDQDDVGIGGDQDDVGIEGEIGGSVDMRQIERDTGFDWNRAYQADESWRRTYNKLLEKDQERDFDEDFYIHRDGSMRYRGRLGERIYLPDSLLERTIKMAHDNIGHFGY